jgi:hypothetical protein
MALEGGEGSVPRPGCSLPPGKTRYPLCKRLAGPQGRSGQVLKISPPPGFDPQSTARNQSLYWLSYPADFETYRHEIILELLSPPSYQEVRLRYLSHNKGVIQLPKCWKHDCITEYNFSSNWMRTRYCPLFHAHSLLDFPQMPHHFHKAVFIKL